MIKTNDYVHAIKQLVNQLDREAKIAAMKQLKGSTSSTLYEVSLEQGSWREIVIRFFDHVEWLREEPDVPQHEVASLQIAANATIKTPAYIALYEAAPIVGMPAIVMEKLPGGVVLDPGERHQWACQLARALYAIHQLDADAFPWEYASYHTEKDLNIPAWTDSPESWKQAIQIVRGRWPTFHSCLIHRDYHPANVLWQDGAVSGVVDWANACRGPAAVDLGHCRINLALLHDVETADAFLQAYESLSEGKFIYDAYWDLVSVFDFLLGPLQVYPGWLAFGMTGLTDKLMEERMDTYVKHIIANK